MAWGVAWTTGSLAEWWGLVCPLAAPGVERSEGVRFGVKEVIRLGQGNGERGR